MKNFTSELKKTFSDYDKKKKEKKMFIIQFVLKEDRTFKFQAFSYNAFKVE